METKLGSLPTVGSVKVKRETITDPNPTNYPTNFRGYKWFVTFLTLEGDIPMLEVDVAPSDGPILSDASPPVMKEEVKGVPLDYVVYFNDLSPGLEYTAEVYATNAIGNGSHLLKCRIKAWE